MAHPTTPSPPPTKINTFVVDGNPGERSGFANERGASSATHQGLISSPPSAVGTGGEPRHFRRILAVSGVAGTPRWKRASVA